MTPKNLVPAETLFVHILLPVTALLEKAEGKMKVCCQTGYRTQDPRLTSQVPTKSEF